MYQSDSSENNLYSVSPLFIDYLSSPMLSHLHTLAQIARGSIWQHMCCQTKSPNSFKAQFAHPELGIICIGSESCLWSIIGLPGSCVCYLTFRLLARVVKGELLWLCFWFVQSSTSVEKAENWLSWCGESWSSIRRFKIFCDFFCLVRRIVLHPIRCLQHPSPD